MTLDHHDVHAETIWRTRALDRWFIIPDAIAHTPGALAIISLAGDDEQIDPTWAARFEVTADEAHAWAAQEFGIALAEVRRRIDRKLGRMRASLDAARRAPVGAGTSMTADALPAILSLAKTLPRAILDGLSGDPARVVAANGRLAGVEERLNQAGIAVDRRLSDFPYRLAGLREETARSRGGKDDRG